MNTNPAAGYYAGPCSCCSNPGNWEVFSPQGVPCLWSSSDKKLVESVCELLNSLLSTPSPTEGASPADANTELVQKEVGEGLREALQSILDHLVMVDENWNPEDSELRGRVKNMIAEADAALAAPAPKPAPPVEREHDLEIMLGYAMEGRCMVCGWPIAASANEGCVQGNCSFRPQDSPFQQTWHRRAEIAGAVRRAAERKPPR